MNGSIETIERLIIPDIW